MITSFDPINDIALHFLGPLFQFDLCYDLCSKIVVSDIVSNCVSLSLKLWLINTNHGYSTLKLRTDQNKQGKRHFIIYESFRRKKCKQKLLSVFLAFVCFGKKWKIIFQIKIHIFSDNWITSEAIIALENLDQTVTPFTGRLFLCSKYYWKIGLKAMRYSERNSLNRLISLNTRFEFWWEDSYQILIGSVSDMPVMALVGVFAAGLEFKTSQTIDHVFTGLTLLSHLSFSHKLQTKSVSLRSKR